MASEATFGTLSHSGTDKHKQTCQVFRPRKRRHAWLPNPVQVCWKMKNKKYKVEL